MIIANSPNPSYFSWFAELNAREKGFDFTYIFLTTQKPDLIERLKPFEVEGLWYYFNYKSSKYLQYLKLLFKLFFLFRKTKPDVVQTNLFDDSLVALFAARLAGVKKRVITKQDTGFHITYYPKYILFDKFNNLNATHILPVSQESEELILKYEKPDVKKIRIVHHAVDENKIVLSNPVIVEELKNKYNLHGKIVIGTVSRYVTLKGYLELIQAVKILKTQFPNIRFLGAGWGPDKEKIIEAINKEGLGSEFILTDRISFDAMPSFYRCLSVYVHAAYYEPFGFVFAEAMFNKIPIVSTRVGAVRDVLTQGESCCFTEFNDPQQLADGITLLLNEPDLKQKIADNAYTIAKNKFSKEIMWNNYKSIFS
jgi:glycosyltransferase involved in cell wall biosynthesis